MRILRGASVARLAAMMLGAERGALIFGPDLSPLSPPYESWPCVRLKTRTIHYKPAVGIVFYTAGEGFCVAALVRKVAALLDSADATLSGHAQLIATDATLFSVIRRRSDMKRRIIVHSPTSLALPSAECSLSTFTWVFMSAAAALEVSHFADMTSANAMLASILYDHGLLTPPHMDGTDVYKLCRADLRLGVPASGLQATLPPGAALIVKDGTISFIGNHEYYRPGGFGPQSQRPGGFGPLDEVKHEFTRGVCYQCCHCGAPVAGGAVLVWGAKIPHPLTHPGRLVLAGAPGSPLPGEAFLCLYCFGAIESPACVKEHLGARVARVVVPLTLSQSFAICSDAQLRRLAPLIGKSAEKMQDLPAYVIKSLNVVIADAKLGKEPAVLAPAIAKLNLPVIGGLRLLS
jgi:hypothetical protein